MNGWALGAVIWIVSGFILAALWGRIGWVLHNERERARRMREDHDDAAD